MSNHFQNESENLGQQTPGRPVILPSSFSGGPRFMQQKYQDAMAMVTKHGKPDLFLTFTRNPNHPDIIENLGNDPRWSHVRLSASDRPDIVVAVFKLHLDELIHDIKLKGVLGKHLSSIYVIEYQKKRGLSNAHMLIWLTTKLRTPDDIDSLNLISAEIPNMQISPELHTIVTNRMIHGPCGLANPTAPCMVDGKCSKDFPKDFAAHTVLKSDGYPQYRRSDSGLFIVKNDVRLDNRFVVPYCPYLTHKYNAHINLEACMSIKSIRYIFKYIYKGYDCARIQTTDRDPHINDEIKSYQDARYVSAPEDVWRLSEFEMHNATDTVIRLDIHLPDQHTITFRDNCNIDEPRDYTKLTKFFDLNRDHAEARQYLYSEIPYHYRWDKNEWKKRKRRVNEANIVSRIYSVSPRQRERFYLRLLLLHVRGPISFNDLKTYGDVVHDTFESGL